MSSIIYDPLVDAKSCNINWLHVDTVLSITLNTACSPALFALRSSFPFCYSTKRFLMRVDELDYQLPEDRIAQRPLAERSGSRLLLLDRSGGSWEDRQFAELPPLLRGDELLVFNNARVIPARLFGRRVGVHSQHPSRKTARENLTGTVEVFLIRRLEEDRWEALVRPGRKMQVGERVSFGSRRTRGRNPVPRRTGIAHHSFARQQPIGSGREH